LKWPGAAHRHLLLRQVQDARGRGPPAAARAYTCSTKARQDKTVRDDRTIPMDKLDPLVADRLESRLL
jgi:hypothetical protein